MMYNNWSWPGMMGGFGFGWILMILFWGIIIWAIFAFVRDSNGGGCCSWGNRGHEKKDQSKDSSLDILRERYAKGEIKKEEYEEKRKDLEK